MIDWDLRLVCQADDDGQAVVHLDEVSEGPTQPIPRAPSIISTLSPQGRWHPLW
jgi:hypothetical protein